VVGGIVVGVVVVLVVVVLAALAIYDHSRANTISRGVSVAGIDIGGLSVSAARERLRRRLQMPLQAPVVVTVGARRFRISPRAAHVYVNVDQAAYQALAAGRGGWFVGRVIDDIRGRDLNVDVTPQVSFNEPAVRHLVARISAAAHRPAQDASVQPTASSLRRVPSHNGVSVRTGHLLARVQDALAHPGRPRTIAAPLHVLRPKVTMHALATKYPAYIVINRNGFELRLYQRLRLRHTYTIAVGMQGLETPAGLYAIQEKEVNPSWHVPNSSWAGALAGQTIPPGPQDPLKARWMGFNGGAGIHGTEDTGSLGSAASHGCIRMSIPDVIALYPKVQVGTPVYVI
jgi:lipoprotein-anchoring transpeptidase ErfK/SrfK